VSNEHKEAKKTSCSGLRYFNEYLNAVATVDHKKTEINAYLYATSFIIYIFPLKKEEIVS
jgi:hypothetical protein